MVLMTVLLDQLEAILHLILLPQLFSPQKVVVELLMELLLVAQVDLGEEEDMVELVVTPVLPFNLLNQVIQVLMVMVIMVDLVKVELLIT